MRGLVIAACTLLAGVIVYKALEDGTSQNEENTSENEEGRQYPPVPRTAPTGTRTKRTSDTARTALRRSPAEKDFNLRPFQIVNPEGELHTVNTADPSSPFHGPVWTRVLDCYKKEAFIRGRAFLRRISQEDRFSGYSVDVDGIEVFLPKSKADYFYDTEKDATGKCVALKVEMVHPNGPKRGTVIVSAKDPWKLTQGEFRDMFPGKTVEVLALDHEYENLIFPGHYEQEIGRRVYQNILVPLDDALRVGAKSGIPAEPGYLTGLYWKLKLIRSLGNDWLAEPLEAMI